MTVRYVGIGGDDGATGLSWALRKATLNGAENTPVAAGDVIYVGPGTYREMLTQDVAGTAGNPITYIGDYLGTNTDGVGGLVRITGSDDDLTATRASCVTTGRAYRSYTGFLMDMTTAYLIAGGNAQNYTISQCFFPPNAGGGVTINGGTSSINALIQNCVFFGHRTTTPLSLNFSYGTQIDASGHVVQNCLFCGGGYHVGFTRMGGAVVKNSTFLWLGQQSIGAVRSEIAFTGGVVITVTNSIFYGCGAGLSAPAGTTVDITEDYNTFWGNYGDRVNVNAGAHSVAYNPMFDSRWFWQLVYAGAGPSSVMQLLTPFDLASFSALVNLAGTSPTTTDMRGTAVQGAQREWGALEYDATLRLFAMRTPRQSGFAPLFVF